MKVLQFFNSRFQGFIQTVTRFPLTFVLLLLFTILNSIEINTTIKNYDRIGSTFVMGIFLSIVAHIFYERFFRGLKEKLFLYGASILLTVGYYLWINSYDNIPTDVMIRSFVILFILGILFLWVPVYKSKTSFNESFLAAYKAFFSTVFFAGILFLGIALVLAAIDHLIVSVDYKAYPHTANLVFVLFATTLFLSMIPLYPGKQNENNQTAQSSFTYPKFLEVLLSYIIIPIVALFTIILVLYLVLNITNNFWTDNLMEPMLVTYSITVIAVYLLASRLENKFAHYFRLIFPKVLVPIVLFQTISSILRISSDGLTHGRYYVIIFGVFSVIAGVLFSILPVRKNGIVAVVLILLSTISILPPVDAFTISRLSQTKVLKNVLVENNMLSNDRITPNSDLSKEDQDKIRYSFRYLRSMGYDNNIKWLDDFNETNDFESTFGFPQYHYSYTQDNYIYRYLERNTPISITGFDYMIETTISNRYIKEGEIGTFDHQGSSFSLFQEEMVNGNDFVLYDEYQQEIARIKSEEIFQSFMNHNQTNTFLSAEEATLVWNFDQVNISIVLQQVNINQSQEDSYQSADMYLFVEMKD